VKHFTLFRSKLDHFALVLTRIETMRIMLLAAAVALSLGVGSAYADKERTAPLPSPSVPSEVADNALDSGAKAVIPDSVDRAPVQKVQPVVPAANGSRQDRPWILLY
jgi:hypothetical protein